MHTCCCNVLVGRECTTRLGACELVDGTRILQDEAAGPNGLGKCSRREVRVGIEFSSAIVGSERIVLFLLVGIGDIEIVSGDWCSI